MSDEQREITDDMHISDLTVGEFKQLMQSMMGQPATSASSSKVDPPIEKIAMRRKSLDEFMDDLGEK